MTLAIGFRVKSGYAVAVALRGPASAPAVVSRHVVTLSDPDEADTRQPYHHGFHTQEDNTREIARRVGVVKRCATESVAALIKALPLQADRSRLRAALVVGSVIDPEQVGNPHIRAHASEGRLFRTVLEDALRAHGVACDVIVEKQLAAKAVAGLKRRDGEIRKTLAAFGKTMGGPWRAEEKAASTAAWIALASRAPRSVAERARAVSTSRP
jgi:hypothetical protein